MKKYIRLENGKIIDLEETKERITSNEYYTDYRDFELFYNESCDKLCLNWKATCTEKCTIQKAGATHNGGIVFNYGSAKIVAESDDIDGLIIRRGDLVCDPEFGNTPFEVENSESIGYEKSVDVLTIFNDKLRYYSFLYKDITKLYTKQDDNYILVWEKERGII